MKGEIHVWMPMIGVVRQDSKQVDLVLTADGRLPWSI